MGKAARNEITKLRATRVNNIGVGLFIAGFVGPYFAYTSRIIEQQGFFHAIALDDLKAAIPVLVPSFLAYFASLWARSRARKILEAIED